VHRKAIRHIEPIAKTNGINTFLIHNKTGISRILLPRKILVINKATIETTKLIAIVGGGSPFKKRIYDKGRENNNNTPVYNCSFAISPTALNANQ